MSEHVCRPCAEAKGAIFRPNIKVDYSIGQCKFCKSTMHVVFPVACWEWPEKIYFDARAMNAKVV
jgi:hypothetical protein